MVMLRIFAAGCQPGDAVPWEQLEGAQPFTDRERGNFKRITGIYIGKNEVVVRYDSCRLFVKSGDLAICFYNYPRDFR